jgi:peptide/nickel transport system substrate-binding protein
VRRAIATAVDRAEVADRARPGAARATQTAIPENNFYHYDYTPFETDEDAARRLLEQAGVSTPVSMSLMVTDEFPESVTAGRVIADQLQPIGIDVRVEVLDFATWLDRQRSGEFDALLLSWLGNIDPAAFYESQHVTGGPNNYQGYSNAEVDALLTAASTEVDEDSRKELYDRAAQQIVDDVSYLYLYNPDVVQAWASGLTGYRIRADRAIEFEDVDLP